MALDTFNPYLFVSSGEQSNKFLTPTYADGIAKFQAQRAQSLTGLTVQINPVQSGSGDPSPTNIRPISGRTGMTVTRAGRNIAQINNIDIPAEVGSQRTVDISSPIALSAGTYTLSWTFTGNVTQTRNQPLYAINEVQTYSNKNCSTSGRYSWTFTLAADATLTFRWWSNNLSAACSATDFMLEFGDTAHEYAPYVTPTTYPITWESIAGTVYGGTLDVVSGVLTVTDAQIASYAGETLPGEWISDRDVYVAGTTPTTGAQVVYKLATPQTYQLTPTEVRTLTGFNQIYSDAGPVIDIKF